MNIKKISAIIGQKINAPHTKIENPFFWPIVASVIWTGRDTPLGQSHHLFCVKDDFIITIKRFGQLEQNVITVFLYNNDNDKSIT